jgi:hypothetical protein
MSTRKRLFNYIRKEGSRFYTYEELKTVAGTNSWTRTLRQLKQDGNLDFEYNASNRGYRINDISNELLKSVRTGINSKLAYKIRHRDFHTCQSCGKTPKDGVKLHVDHRVPVEWGGTNAEDNLWTLCDDCNHGKKSFFKDDFDPKIMKRINQETNAESRLKILFDECKNTPLNSTILQSVAGIQDWPRSIRRLRRETNWNIQYFAKSKSNPQAYYINIVE